MMSETLTLLVAAKTCQARALLPEGISVEEFYGEITGYCSP
jgi:hypothetical protein